MTPSYFSCDMRNAGWDDRKHSCQLVLFKFFLRIQSSNFENVFFSKFCSSVFYSTIIRGLFESRRIGMFIIFRIRDIFQIFQTVISFNTINMINNQPIHAFAQKSVGDKISNSVRFRSWPIEINMKISLWVHLWFQNFSNICISDSRSVSSYASKIRNRVIFFITDDFLPNFHNKIITQRGVHGT